MAPVLCPSGEKETENVCHEQDKTSNILEEQLRYLKTGFQGLFQ